jgi:CMP-N,N'-diacetyllegionaminic acid synthase
MKILVLILARGGSKRLPNKNIRLLGGKPLINWSIDFAKKLPYVVNILVSTDSAKIAEVAKSAGAYVPWLRPNNLSLDTTSSVDSALHAINWYENTYGKVDGLLLLQPTSPFRDLDLAISGLNLFHTDLIPVISVSRSKEHPLWTLKTKGKYLEPFFENHGFGQRSQDLPDSFIVNGSIYIITPYQLRNERTFVPSLVSPLLCISEFENIDIDTEEDFNNAEYMLSTRNFHS